MDFSSTNLNRLRKVEFNFSLYQQKYLTKFIGVRTKYIFLAHLSEENNTKELALNTLKDKLVKENKSVDNIIVAEQNKETELIMI